MRKHYSSTFAIAEATGVHPNTVRNFLRNPARREWHKLDEDKKKAAIAAIRTGLAVSAKRPLRYSPPLNQIAFAFD